ncbi:MAG: hypothetical protein ACYCS7_16000 [Acidimicrobiales bacterium]
MGEIIGAAIAIVALAFTMVSGLTVATAYSARADISTITTQAAADMSVNGGYTSAVQAAILAALAARGFTAQPTIQVSPQGPDYYGQTYTITIDYPLTVDMAGAQVPAPIQTSAPGVSTYPCTATEAQAGACTAPATITPLSTGGG